MLGARVGLGVALPVVASVPPPQAAKTRLKAQAPVVRAKQEEEGFSVFFMVSDQKKLLAMTAQRRASALA